jgi:hypothetical protein
MRVPLSEEPPETAVAGPTLNAQLVLFECQLFIDLDHNFFSLSSTQLCFYKHPFWDGSNWDYMKGQRFQHGKANRGGEYFTG